MKQREKKLLTGLIGVVALAVGLSIYPTTIRPMFEGDGGVEDAGKRLAELGEELESRETSLHDKYRTLVLRNGGVDASTWQDQLYESLVNLRNSVKLGGQIRPKPVSINPKTKIATLKISVSAKGTFAQCVEFVRGFYKLPFVARLASLKLVPTASQHRANHDEVTLDAEIEAMLMPQSEEWGLPPGKQPEDFDRIASADINMLRNWRPFNPYVKPDEPTPLPTIEPGPTPRPTPTPDPGDLGPDEWADANELIMKMVSGYGSGDYWVREVLLENVMDFSTRYVAAGESLDGGELVLVHALGAVVRKKAADRDFGYWVYPLGELLSARMRLEDSAGAWPEIYVAARQYLQDRGETAPPPSAQTAADPGAAAAAMDTELTDVEMDRILSEGLAELATAAGQDEMGPPLPPTAAEAAAVHDDEAPADDADIATDGLAFPQRPSGSAVQDAGGRRVRSRTQHPGATGAKAPDAPTEKTPSALRPGAGRPAVRPSTPARGARRPAPKPEEESKEETDDVAPPE